MLYKLHHHSKKYLEDDLDDQDNIDCNVLDIEQQFLIKYPSQPVPNYQLHEFLLHLKEAALLQLSNQVIK
jgi:hypothetical protein